MKQKKVLIIDDDPRNVFALSAYLRSKEFTCFSALSTAEGLNILQSQHDIGAVLMDMMMPETDGYEAITQIRQQPATKKLPVIAVTANAMTGDKEKCLRAGADHYISKPIKVEALVGMLNEYFKSDH